MSCSPSIDTARAPRILLVDDDQILVSFVAMILEDAGYEVLCSHSGDDALRITAETQCLELLITDLTMPGLSGAGLVRKVRETREDLPVLYLSGYNKEQLTEGELAGSDDDLLLKPFEPSALIAKVEQIISRHRAEEDRGTV